MTSIYSYLKASFTAAQAAQKKSDAKPIPANLFTAAQAAQKKTRGSKFFPETFTAAQAAQKTKP